MGPGLWGRVRWRPEQEEAWGRGGSDLGLAQLGGGVLGLDHLPWDRMRQVSCQDLWALMEQTEKWGEAGGFMGPP